MILCSEEGSLPGSRDLLSQELGPGKVGSKVVFHQLHHEEPVIVNLPWTNTINYELVEKNEVKNCIKLRHQFFKLESVDIKLLSKCY